jgi:hypothetical protein
MSANMIIGRWRRREEVKKADKKGGSLQRRPSFYYNRKGTAKEAESQYTKFDCS